MAPERGLFFPEQEEEIVDLHNNFTAGIISEDEFRAKIVPALHRIKSAAIEQEGVLTGWYDKLLKRESLVTDSSGHRTGQWFDESGLSFASGMATNCLALALVHPEAGVAMAHYDIATPENVAELMISRQKNSIGGLMDYYRGDVLQGFMNSTLDSLFREFDALDPPRTKSLSLYGVGMDFVPQFDINKVISSLEKSYQTVSSTRPYLRGTEVFGEIYLGVAGNIVCMPDGRVLITE